MCLNESYSTVHVSKHFCDTFLIQSGLQQGDALSPLLFNFVLKYAIRRIKENHDGLKLIWTHHPLAYADDVNIVGKKHRYYKGKCRSFITCQ
jgi:hypothetical protein